MRDQTWDKTVFQPFASNFLPNILQNVGLSSMIITFFMLLPPQFSFVRL